MSGTVSLDSFRTAQPHAGVPCDECGETRSCICFWEAEEESIDPGLPPSYSVCPYCFTRVTGRFKNESPVQLLRGMEEVTSWSLQDEYLMIGTRSPLGYFFHIHYVDSGYVPVGTTLDRVTGEPSIRYAPVVELEGSTDVFDEHGVGLGLRSPYSDLAGKLLRSHSP